MRYMKTLENGDVGIYEWDGTMCTIDGFTVPMMRLARTLPSLAAHILHRGPVDWDAEWAEVVRWLETQPPEDH